MARGVPSSRKRRFRLRRLIAYSVALTVIIVGAYNLYNYRRQQNTQRLLAIADKAANEKNWRMAVQNYRQYLLRPPSAPEVLSRYARSLIELSKDDPRVVGRTLETLKKLNRSDPDNLYCITELAQLYIALREYRLAELHAQQWINMAQHDPKAHAILAAARRGLGNLDLAAEGLVQAVEQMPHETSLYPLLVSIYLMDINDKESARLWMTRGLTVEPQSPEVQVAAYSFYRNINDIPRAQTHLDQALAFGPQYVPALMAAANEALQKDQPDKAKELLDRVENLEPSHRGRLQLLSTWARTTHAPANLIDVADEMVQRANHIDLDLIARAAELYLDARLIEKADSCIDTIAQTRSRSPRIQIWFHALKGTRALLNQDAIEAARQFELVLKLSPTDEKTLKLAALAYLNSGNLSATATMYRRLLLVNEHAASARLGLAQLEWIQGRRHGIQAWLDGANTKTKRQRQLFELLSVAATLTSTPFSTLSQQRKEELQQTLISCANRIPADSIPARILSDCFALTDFAHTCASWIQSHLKDSEVVLTLALRYADHLQAIQSDQTRAWRKIIIDAYPDSPRAHLMQIRAILATNQPEKVRQYIESVTLDSQPMGKMLLGVATMQRRLSQPDEACITLRQAVQLNPHDMTAATLLAELTTDTNESLDIADHLRQQFGENDLQWRVIRAAALLGTNDNKQHIQEAMQLLQMCIDQRPRWVQPRILLGDAHALQGHLNQSIEIYRSAISELPELGTGPVAARLVTALNRLGRFIEADAALNSLARSNPDEPTVLRLRTQYYMRTQDLTSAIETAERLLAASDNDPAWAATTSSLHWRSGNHQRAEEIARDYLQRHPQEPALWWSLTRALIAQKKEDTAIASLYQAAQTYNSGQLYILLAQLYAGLDQMDKAETSIAKALEIGQDDTTILATCAQFWSMHDNPQKQRSLMERALIAGGENPLTSIRLARFYLSSSLPEDRQRSEIIIQHRLKQLPDDAQAKAIKGQLASISHPPDYDTAEKYLKEAITSDPSIQQIHKVLASVQIRQGKLLAADKTVSAGLAIDPYDTDLLLASAELAVYRGQHIRAIAPLRQVLEKRANDYAALDLIATSYMALGQQNQAIRFIRRITPNMNTSAGAMVALARLYESKGDTIKARELWNTFDVDTIESSAVFQALLRFHARQHEWERMQEIAQARRSTFPNDIDSLKFAAQVLGLRQDDKAARSIGMAWLRDIAQAYPAHSADALYRLGLCYYESKQYVDAESHFLQAIGMNANSTEMVNALAWLYCEHMNKPQQAAHLIDRFLTSGGLPNAQMLDTQGVILTRLGQSDKAHSILRKCIRVAGQTPTLTAATYHLGMALAQHGKHEQVDRHFRDALLLNNRLGGLNEQEKNVIAEALGNSKSR